MAIKYSNLRDVNNRIQLAEAIPLKGPLTIHVEATNICNFRCSFCPESLSNFMEEQGGRHTINITDFEKILSQISAFKTVKTVNFYMMGEPFINKNIESLVKRASELKIADKLILTIGEAHIYNSHLEAIQTQIARYPYPFPQLHIHREDITLENLHTLQYNDFQLRGYECHPSLKMEMSV